MARIVPIEEGRRVRARKGRRLCEHGFHHWELDPGSAHHAPGRKDLLWCCARCAATCVGPTPGTPAGTPPPAPQDQDADN